MHGDKWRWGLVRSGCCRPRLHHEAAATGGHGLQDGERRAPLAGRGEAVHPDLPHPCRRSQVRLPLGPQLHLPDGDVPKINRRFDHILGTDHTDRIRTNPTIQSSRQSVFLTTVTHAHWSDRPACALVDLFLSCCPNQRGLEGEWQCARGLMVLASNRVQVLRRFRQGLAPRRRGYGRVLGSSCEAAAMAVAGEFGS